GIDGAVAPLGALRFIARTFYLTAPLRQRGVVLCVTELHRAQRGFEPGWRDRGVDRVGHSVVDPQTADAHAGLASTVDEGGASAVIARGRVAAAVVNAQAASAASARRDPLQQRCALSHGALRLMMPWMRVRRDAHLVGLERRPVDKAGM